MQVKREATGDSWFVLRRYSDFVQLYNSLPRSFAAITPPLPPKSWRSHLFLSMTQVSGKLSKNKNEVKRQPNCVRIFRCLLAEEGIYCHMADAPQRLFILPTTKGFSGRATSGLRSGSPEVDYQRHSRGRRRPIRLKSILGISYKSRSKLARKLGRESRPPLGSNAI